MEKTIERKIEIPFTKARNRKYADNFDFEHECDLDLYEDERCIALISATDNSFYHVTNKRIVNKNNKIDIKYADIKKCHWRNEDMIKAAQQKEYYDRLIIYNKDHQRFVLNNLGDSYAPLENAINWILRERD